MAKQIIDGCTAATYAAYALSEIATIYPITPVASMGETADKWGLAGRLNLMGNTMQVKEMESELGAAGATHGALAAGALATTFTASQGLLLMIPNMYKISGELLPAVFHVGARSIATHALSIFGDHQDVMACRATGFAMLASASVQEAEDLGFVAHIAAIDGSVPVLHFFDGWRTSNEMSTIDLVDYDKISPLVNWDKVNAFRAQAMNPEHPDLRGSAQNADVYFQNREAANRFYDAFPAVVQNVMDRYAAVTGRQYHLFDYVGVPDAEIVLVSMASSCEVIDETLSFLNAHGYKAGVIKVRLYRPFDAKAMIDALPASVKTIAVLDRTKEPGAQGEPLYQDVVTAVHTAGLNIKVIGGRYGLSSKEFDPAMVKAVCDEAMKPSPKQQFTVGIDDDVTHLSLDYDKTHFIITPPDVVQCEFYGMGSDGTVGATRQAASIIGNATGMYAQAYFQYSAKKSGGYTISQLRFGPRPVTSAYRIKNADYICCNKSNYVHRFTLLSNIKQGGIFVLNSPWTLEDMEREFPPRLKRRIAAAKVRFYNIDAAAIAEKCNLGVRINTIMEAVFLHLKPVMPESESIPLLKKAITASYTHEGGEVVNQNIAAVDMAIAAVREIAYPASWADATDVDEAAAVSVPEFVKNVARPCLDLLGNDLPVSAFSPSGAMPMGTTAYEKRSIALKVPEWHFDKCVECTECSLVCPHAAIRPYLLTDTELASAPEGFDVKPARAKALAGLNFRIQVYAQDCTGCASCATICPGHALEMVPLASQIPQQVEALDFVRAHVSIKDNLLPKNTIPGTQLCEPCLEFSGACAGCGETPYVKLLTQLFGSRMLIANATGCSSIWGANFPSNAYCTDRNGHGPAWGNSLFEDNAEYGYGMACAVSHRREALRQAASRLAADASCSQAVRDAADAWIEAFDSPDDSARTAKALVDAIGSAPANPDAAKILHHADMLASKSIWAIGGDGWAYDIGFAGLDHVLAQNANINILVMDTECYSNTGGQTSKATPLGAVMKYAADGKRTVKKDLGRMMMSYGHVYVASVALGANYQQTISALMEAEAYPGPSIVIAYCPCINHGIRSGMSHTIVEEKLAVKSGYWQLYRYNPDLARQGKEPLIVDYPQPDNSLVQFINGEDRYADLRMIDPKDAALLQPALAKRVQKLYSIITSQSKIGPLG